MKLQFINPDEIMGVVLALLVLAVGVFASFTVFASIPTTTPVSSCNTLGNGTLGPITPMINFNDSKYVPVPGAHNNTACVELWANQNATHVWVQEQAAGAANGTFMANGTYRITGGTLKRFNTSVYVLYPTAPTATLTNSTYTAVINVSQTSTQVFNIIGVVLVIASIMSIVGLVYSYIRPRL